MDEKELQKNKEHVSPAPEEKELPKPLTKKDIRAAIDVRMDRINEEFRRGFELMSKYDKSVTFFGSARFKPEHVFYQKAKSLADKIADMGYDVITGGGPGIMEAGNWGAILSEGEGQSIGLSIELPDEQLVNEYTDETAAFHYFFARKVLLAFSAEAYVFFPGGFGTLDEFFEIVTLVQTRKIEKVPVICVGENYWGALDEFIKKTLEETFLTISPGDRDIYTITEDEEKIIEIIKNAPLREE